MEAPHPTPTVPMLLLQQITELMRSSGANQTEAKCALKAAIAMVPEMGLKEKPFAVLG